MNSVQGTRSFLLPVESVTASIKCSVDSTVDRHYEKIRYVFYKRMTFRAFLEGLKEATHSNAEFVWIPESFLQEQGVYPQSLSNWLLNFPYCRSANLEAESKGQISSQRAFDSGWQTRPLRDTAFDCLQYFSSLNGYEFRDTLPAAKQEEILTLWRSQHG